MGEGRQGVRRPHRLNDAMSSGIDVRWISPTAVEQHGETDIASLLSRSDGFLWVDIPQCDDRATAILTDVFRFHPLAVRDSQEPTPVPKIHTYRDHFYVVLHSLERDQAGQIHHLELDQFVSLRYLVTVHGHFDDGIPRELAFRETREVTSRLETGRFRPKLPGELGHAIVSALARRLGAFVTSLAARIAALERRVVTGDTKNYEALLAEMFQVRHELLAVRTVAAQSREVYARMAAFSHNMLPEVNLWVNDLVDQFDRLRNVCDGEKELFQEILDLYQARIGNEMTRFVKRLTSVGAILVSDTLIAGIYGMNFEVMPELKWQFGYAWALGLMVITSAVLAWYFRRKDWL
jgi:magnesium transporter